MRLTRRFALLEREITMEKRMGFSLQYRKSLDRFRGETVNVGFPVH